MAQNDKSNRASGHSGQQAASIRKQKAKLANRAEIAASAAALGISPDALLQQRRDEAVVLKSAPRIIVSIPRGPFVPYKAATISRSSSHR